MRSVALHFRQALSIAGKVIGFDGASPNDGGPLAAGTDSSDKKRGKCIRLVQKQQKTEAVQSAIKYMQANKWSN
jgi:hypothetical protein